jgi:hypothetical protein
MINLLRRSGALTGTPPARVLAALGKRPTERDALFFTGVNREFGGRTPVEVLASALTVPRDLDTGALALLRAPADERLEAAVEAANLSNDQAGRESWPPQLVRAIDCAGLRAGDQNRTRQPHGDPGRVCAAGWDRPGLLRASLSEARRSPHRRCRCASPAGPSSGGHTCAPTGVCLDGAPCG